MESLQKYGIKGLRIRSRSAKAPKWRKENTRSKIVRFLILCEGEKTEPNYFKALIQYHQSVVQEKDIVGCRCSTCALVDKAFKMQKELEAKRQLPFDRVWIVFDKDDFIDFNEAIRRAKQKSIHCAWSNEAFELWYFLHFQYLDTGISRYDYIEKIENEIRRHPEYKKFKYCKNDPEFYHLLQELGDEEFAKKGAARLRAHFKNDDDYKAHKPCTTVDLLIEELEHPEKVLL